MSTHYDAIIIGGGPGGYSTALRIAQLGGKVAIIEKAQFGGICATKGCIPTKAMLNYVKDKEPDSLDLKRLNRIKDRSVKRSVQGVQYLLKQRNIDIFKGIGKIADRNNVQVHIGMEVNELSGDNVVIATGTSPRDIPSAHIDGKFILSSDHILDEIRPIDSLVIIGGGVIGVEFASLFNRLGTDVTIIEMMPQLVPTEDGDVAELLKKVFKRDGIHVFTGSKVESAERGLVQFKDDDNLVQTIETEKVLLAVGRAPNLDVKEMERLGVELERGFIKVNEFMQTSVKGIFAVGDIVGKYMLAHTAYFQGRAAAETIMGRLSRADPKIVPHTIYSIPEIGSVGLNIIGKRGDLSCVKVPFRMIASAQFESSNEGFLKMWHDGWRLHAVTVIGPGAPEIISLASLALQYGGDLHVLENVIIPHPSLSEIFSEAVFTARGANFHTGY